jgi:FixJ family two-component response regulator
LQIFFLDTCSLKLEFYYMSLIPKKGTVYVVDDDEAVRDSLQWLLEGKDYRVRCFDSAETFLSRYDAREVAC